MNANKRKFNCKVQIVLVLVVSLAIALIGCDDEDRDLEAGFRNPPNATATAYVPARRIEDVTESGKNIRKTQGMKLLRMEKNKAVFKVQSGSYEFASKHCQDNL